jgi:triphosphoribosyl-dephospho-CoA synthase
MERSAERDGVAREWVGGHERTFDAAAAIRERTGPLPDRAAAVYLDLLASEPDSFVADTHSPRTARSVMVRAQEAREGGPQLVETFADSLVAEGINPGTTADTIAGALFVALERGAEV